MRAALTIFRREFSGYFATPLALVFLVIFLVMQGLFTFYLGGFYTNEQANLAAFFNYHPWLYLFLMPAVAMRLWAEERKSGTMELLLTLPIAAGAAVVGKYLAALAFAGLALALTFPLWLTVNYLGDPDNGVILVAYLGSFLMAGSYLAIGAAVSAMNRNQVVAFIITVSICFLHLVAGLPIVLDTAGAVLPEPLLLLVANLSFLTHFAALQKGVVTFVDTLFFLSLTALWLWIGQLVVESKREAG